MSFQVLVLYPVPLGAALTYCELDNDSRQPATERWGGVLHSSTVSSAIPCPCLESIHSIIHVEHRPCFRVYVRYAGILCEAYHAGLPDKERTRVLSDWAAGRTPVVAATVAFGMGIDRACVRLVVHLDLPKTLEGFYQVHRAFTAAFQCALP